MYIISKSFLNYFANAIITFLQALIISYDLKYLEETNRSHKNLTELRDQISIFLFKNYLVRITILRTPQLYSPDPFNS